jgi:hypothetical protein
VFPAPVASCLQQGAARDQAAALMAVDAFYRKQWDKPSGQVAALPSKSSA